VANQMIALQSRGPQLTDPSKLTAQYANMMNMASQQRASQLQAERTRQEMEYAKAAEGRAVAGEGRAADQFNVEQPQRLVAALGGGLIGILRDPSDATLGQVGQTFASVGMDPEKFGPLLKQIQEIPDANDRKLFALEFISRSEVARAALTNVMPEAKSEKVGDATVFYDGNPNSRNFGQPLFQFIAPPEPVKLNQSVVGSTVMNTNPLTGVSAEATIGDPRENLTPAARNPTFASTGVRSPYAVGAGTGQQQPMALPVAPPAQAVGTQPSMGAPGRGNTADVVYGFGKFGSPAKPISQSTIGEVQDFQRNTLIPNTRGKIGAGPREGTGAVGTYQFTYGTLKDYAPKVLGPNWRNVPFTADVQEQLAKALYEDVKGGDLKKTWAGLPSNRPGQYSNVPWENVRDSIIKVESAGGGNRRTLTGGADTPTGAPKTVSQAISEKDKARTFNKFVEVTGFDFKSGKDPVADLIKKSTGGGGEKLGADIMAFIPESMGGGGTKGMDAISALNVVTSDLILTLVPEGKLSAGVSNEDRKLYERLVGDINNPALTRSARLSAWNQLKTRMSRLGGVPMPADNKPKSTPTGGSQGKPKTDKIPTLTAAQVRANPNIKRWRRADNGEIMVRK
jgi:hypothetical protein